MTRAPIQTGNETPSERAERLARETVEVARACEPEVPCDDDRALELELFFCAGYEQALRDLCIPTGDVQ